MEAHLSLIAYRDYSSAQEALRLPIPIHGHTPRARLQSPSRIMAGWARARQRAASSEPRYYVGAHGSHRIGDAIGAPVAFRAAFAAAGRE